MKLTKIFIAFFLIRGLRRHYKVRIAVKGAFANNFMGKYGTYASRALSNQAKDECHQEG